MRIILLPLGVGLFHQCPGGLFVQIFQFHPVMDPPLKGSADKQAQAIHILPRQHKIRAAAHDDAVLLLRQFPDDLALHLKEHILRRLPLLDLGAALIEGLEQPGVAGLFILIGEQFLPYLGPLRRQLQQFPVIVGKPQRLTELPSDLAAAAAKLSAQCDHMLFHRNTPSSFSMRIQRQEPSAEGPRREYSPETSYRSAGSAPPVSGSTLPGASSPPPLPS